MWNEANQLELEMRNGAQRGMRKKKGEGKREKGKSRREKVKGRKEKREKRKEVHGFSLIFTDLFRGKVGNIKGLNPHFSIWKKGVGRPIL